MSHCPGCAARVSDNFPGGHRDGCTEPFIGQPCGSVGLLSACSEPIPCLKHDTMRAKAILWEETGFIRPSGIGDELVEVAKRANVRIAELRDRVNEIAAERDAARSRSTTLADELVQTRSQRDEAIGGLESMRAGLESMTAARDRSYDAVNKLNRMLTDVQEALAIREVQRDHAIAAAAHDREELDKWKARVNEQERILETVTDRLVDVERERDELAEEMTRPVGVDAVIEAVDELAKDAPIQSCGCEGEPHTCGDDDPPFGRDVATNAPGDASSPVREAFLEAVVHATADRLADYIIGEGKI